MIKLIKQTLSNMNVLVQRINELSESVKTIETVFVNSQLEKVKTKNELNQYEFKAFSQNGEDGIINEIFKRLGVEDGFFVEFGVQDGLECNTALLFYKGWKGIWLEADDLFFNQIHINFNHVISTGRLKVKKTFVNNKNLEKILLEENVDVNFDLLSIDIDSNDFWIWDSLDYFNPKVVVIEYNAFFPVGIEWVMPYEENKIWDSTIDFGSSLTSLVGLAEKKGYTLVACSVSGSNAFFVRNDLMGPFQFLDVKDIYHPVNYKLSRKNPVLKKISHTI